MHKGTGTLCTHIFADTGKKKDEKVHLFTDSQFHSFISKG